MVHTDSEWQIAQKVVENALKNTEYASEGLERLGGGFINFAFRNRLTRAIEGYGQTAVVKLTDDKVKGEFTLHKTRSYYEYHMLAQPIPSFCSTDERDDSLSTMVRVPKVFGYFPNDYMQIIEDLPDTMTLKAHLLNQPLRPAFAAAFGRAIGAWAMKFHAWGRHPDQQATRKVLSSYAEAGQFKFRLSCGRLEATVEKFPEMLGSRMHLFKKVSDRVMEFAQGDGTGIIHGDFWPGNLIFASSANSVHGGITRRHYDSQVNKMQLVFVLDWELCHLSSFVIDLGTMFAELYLLYFFKDSPSVPLILDSFLEAYGSIERRDVLNIMIFCGVHLIIWPPRTEWSKNPRLKECIQLGCDILENAYNGNTEWFKNGLFEKLF